MYSYAINFVNAIVNRKELEPIGFFMIGEAGIGKTHLCVAIAKMIAKLGLNVLFLNEEAFKQIEPQSFITNCKKLIDKSDLVVIDDLNKEFSSFNELFHIALEYTIMEDKAILVSSNKDFNISKFIFKYEIDLNKPFKNFFITNNIIGESYRKAWFDGKFTITDIEKMSLSQKIDILSEYKGENPASIVIESDDIDLSSVKKDFLDKSNIKSKKVKIVAPSTGYMGKVSQDYDVFIIKVTNQKECMQMFNLIPKIHNEGKKAIFVIDNKEKFRDLVITTLRNSHVKYYNMLNYYLI